MKSDPDQLIFDFEDGSKHSPAVEETAPEYEAVEKSNDENLEKEGVDVPPEKSPSPNDLKPRDLKRAALAWVATGSPSALALGVPTRISRFKADVAAVWIKPGRKRLLHPVKTMVVEVRRSRSDCWPDCSRREELLAPLRRIKAEKERLEAVLRETEPELRETDMLFDEFESWNYSASVNPDYQRCIKEMRRIERSLYKGSRFERIAQANVADYLYLAVPAGAVAANELADGWGLLHINDDLSVDVVKEADDTHCPEECKAHLAYNIAAASLKSVLFSEGVLLDGGAPMFLRIPKRRRAPGK